MMNVQVGRRRGARIAIALVGALMSALLAGGCGGSADDEIDEIRVLVAGDPEELAAYRELVEAFHSSQSDVRVRLEEVAERDELLARLGTSIATGAPVDAFLLNYRYTGQLVATGAVEPLDDYLEGSSVFGSEEFFEEPLGAFRFDGQQMCLPQNAASLVVYWNEELFAEAGLDPPAADWTWDDMVEAASALTRDDDGDGTVDVYGLGVSPEILRVAPVIWSSGGELVDDPERPTHLAVRSAEALGAIRSFLELRAVHGVTPPEEEAEAEPFESRFAAGRLGMLMESRKVVPGLRAAATFAWDVAPFPTLDEPATVLHSDGYCITSASAAKDDAWRFIEFALGPEGQRITAGAGRTVPSLIEVARSATFLDPAEPPASSEVYLDQLEVARPVPTSPAWPRVEDAANSVLEEAYYETGGRVEAAEVALSLLRATTPLFAGDGG